MDEHSNADAPAAWLLILAGWLCGRALAPTGSLPGPAPGRCEVVEQDAWPQLGPRPRAWRQLAGVGPKRALLAARARWEHDARRGPLEWADVPGIGPVTAAQLDSLDVR